MLIQKKKKPTIDGISKVVEKKLCILGCVCQVAPAKFLKVQVPGGAIRVAQWHSCTKNNIYKLVSQNTLPRLPYP
jgi:hypothetical protein